MEKQLHCTDPKIIRAKAERNEALTLKELAIWTGFSYTFVRNWRGLYADFPMFAGRIFPADFTLWRQKRLGLRSSPDTATRQPKKGAGKSDESLSTHG